MFHKIGTKFHYKADTDVYLDAIMQTIYRLAYKIIFTSYKLKLNKLFQYNFL